MSLQTLLSRLDRVKQTGRGRWVACCPAHDSKSRQSLAITESEDGKVLVHDFGGCSVYDVLASVGMKVDDLFPDARPRSALKTSRMPFSYADALRCVSFEALLAAVAAGNLAQGMSLTLEDRNRLWLAANRINHALEVCQCK
ncbi:DNA primase [Achromobacter xylosoxidans]|uniref:DNA primase n=1 Tax=Alcaligenes xylosoxydans xylosoxydans TaxID=85698 RepID=UPI0015C9722D|nr:DNA primase [Achromobacter xylosoxidans]NYS15694.1 DNA primase [Achromobacter xylosoxidans]